MTAFLSLVAVFSPSARAQFEWTGDQCMEGAWTVALCWCQDCTEYPDSPTDSASVMRGEPTITGVINLLSLTTQMEGSVLLAGDLNYWGSAITNSGQIRLLGGRILPLGNEPFLTLGGPGRVILDGAAPAQGANLTSLSGTTLINTTSHTITGRGLMTIPTMNLGTIAATGDLRIALFDLDNNAGILKSSHANARLRIDRINCTGGLLQSDAGVINLVVASLRNATLRPGNGELTIGDYLFQNYTAASSFDTVTLNGNSRVIYNGELQIPTPCTNNGVLHVDGGGVLRLLNPGGSLVGSGSVLLVPGPDPLGLAIMQGNGRGIGPGQTVHGSGTISHGLQNLGTILADVPGKELLLTTAIGQPPSTYLNQSDIGVVAGSVLRIEHCTVTQMFGGLIRCQNAGSRLVASGTTIDGGSILSSSGGSVQTLGANSWGHGLVIAADVTVTPGTLGFFGVPIANLPSATINGEITLAGVQSPVGNAVVDLPSNGLLEGTGGFLLAAPSEASLATSRITQSDGASTIGPGITIHGSGQFIPSNTTVQGIVRAEGNGRSLVIAGGFFPLINTGTMGATTGASLVIQARPVQNAGGLLDPAGGSIRLEGAAIIGGTLQGVGSMDAAPGFTSAINGLVNQGTIAVRGGATLVVTGPMHNDGLITVNQDGASSTTFLQINGTRTFTGVGEVRLLSPNAADGLRLLGGTLTNGAGHTIRGPGRVLAAVHNSGRLAAGPAPSVWPIDGPLTLDSTSRVQVDLAGTVSARIDVGGTTVLAGELQVSQTLPAALPVGTTFTLLTATSISGSFGSTLLPALNAGQRFSVDYSPNSVMLRVVRTGDFNGDGVVAVADIFAFLSAWFAQSPVSDFDGNGITDVADIFAFLSAWFAGT